MSAVLLHFFIFQAPTEVLLRPGRFANRKVIFACLAGLSAGRPGFAPLALVRLVAIPAPASSGPILDAESFSELPGKQISAEVRLASYMAWSAYSSRSLKVSALRGSNRATPTLNESE